MNFSVLMSVYKNDNPIYFEQALSSIYEKQTLKPNQIVIVKDGPLSLKLEKVLKNFSKICKCRLDIICLLKNVGLGNALNIGLEKCAHEIIARMDSDDVSKPNRFKVQIDFIKNNPNIDVVSSYVDEFDGSVDNIITTKSLPLDHNKCIEILKYGSPFNHPVTVFKKSRVKEVGGYKDFYLKEDTFLWLRMSIKNNIFGNIQESLLFFRVNKNMYKRRRGLKYVNSEIKLFIFRYNNKIINLKELILFGVPTVLIRLLPSIMLKKIYLILRHKQNLKHNKYTYEK
jgi:glycosyltransferase involved in cell wall biosynthesis